jgi:RimK family alpha-L-glutamate ligase
MTSILRGFNQESSLLRIGIITRNQNSFSSLKLREALGRRNILYECFSFPRLVARIRYVPFAKVANLDLHKDLDALIVRPIGRGSVEELVFRMDVLYRLQRSGLYILNPPEAIEHCVDKYDILAILEENGIPVPSTAVTENVAEALIAFNELGRDVIVKPLFGSRGVGATRVNDEEVALTIFRAVTFYHGVIYLQKFVDHGFSDIRAFVIGDRLVASMRRLGRGWKTNYSQGGTPTVIELEKTLEDMATKSASLVDCKVAGVDILESQSGPVVVDVNSQPGWRGLQSVSKIDIADEIVDFVLAELKR